MQVISPWEAAGAAPEDAAMSTEFVGRRWSLLGMAIKLGLLTVLTLGLYRFWMKTRLRRWYWSAFRPGGHPLEYVGDPLEKLLGFLIAVVFLAFYIGIVNLILMFASFSLFNGNVAAYFLSFLGVVPLWFLAAYRARRYVLARSRWRGVRFALEPAAWGYVRVALWHWFLTLISLGLLWPRKAFYLEKYKTDRTHFGTQILQQQGSWFRLLGPWLWVWVPMVSLLGGIIAIAIYFAGLQDEGGLWAILLNMGDVEQAWLEWLGFLTPILIFVMPLWIMVTLVRYQVKTLMYLTTNKQMGEVRATIAPRFWRVFGIYFWGYILSGLVSALCLTPVFAALVIVAERLGADIGGDLGGLEATSQFVVTVVSIASYFLTFLMWAALTHAFVRMPLYRHYAESFTLWNSQHLADIQQRSRDESEQAEGFAEALDVGAAI